jgi:hypothetical protein
VHALENLAMSETGITTLRRLLCEQARGDGLMRDPQRIPTNTWNTILAPVEASVFYDERV